jgi:phage terminase large subunit-like protein
VSEVIDGNDDNDLIDANIIFPGDIADLREIVELGAINGQLFGETFFPKTFRMKSPPFAREVWDALDSHYRLVSLQLFRGAFKTTTCRVFAARRIAYAQARTILWIGISQDKAIESVRWFRKQVEFNSLYAQTFKLRPGSKWQDIHCEVYHGVDETPITILAYGITGPIRGINIDDYRPDLILLDDIVNEEIGASPLQLQSVENLVYGAILQSLSPATETPDAKLVLLQTPIARDDVSMKSLHDAEWKSVRIPCWTKETEDEALENRVSSWEDRFPSATLRKQKQYAIQRNNVSTFTREMELKIVAAENATFLPTWLQYYDLEPDSHFYSVMVIDPVPPPSDAELAKGLKDKDFEVLTIVTRVKDRFYLREYSAKHGHDPSWTISEFFRLALKYRPRRIYVESVAYQRTLAWLLRKAMETQRQYFVVEEMVDKRRKYQRIVDGLSGPASNYKLFVKPKEHSDFIQQFLDYPSVAHDDIIETVAIAVEKLQGPQFGGNVESWSALMEGDEEEDDLPRLVNRNLAP